MMLSLIYLKKMRKRRKSMTMLEMKNTYCYNYYYFDSLMNLNMKSYVNLWNC